jgi:hypothetical protein
MDSYESVRSSVSASNKGPTAEASSSSQDCFNLTTHFHHLHGCEWKECRVGFALAGESTRDFFPFDDQHRHGSLVGPYHHSLPVVG